MKVKHVSGDIEYEVSIEGGDYWVIDRRNNELKDDFATSLVLPKKEYKRVKGTYINYFEETHE